MTKHSHLSRCAGAAIAAALAFGSTPLLAQDAAPGQPAPQDSAAPTAPVQSAPTPAAPVQTAPAPVPGVPQSAAPAPTVPNTQAPAATPAPVAGTGAAQPAPSASNMNTITTQPSAGSPSPANTTVQPPAATGQVPAASAPTVAPQAQNAPAPTVVPMGPVVQQLPPPDPVEETAAEEAAVATTGDTAERAPAAEPQRAAPTAESAPTSAPAADVTARDTTPAMPDEGTAPLGQNAPMAEAPVMETEAAPMASSDSAQPLPAENAQSGDSIGWIGGVLAALGLGGLAMFAFRRRKSAPDTEPRPRAAGGRTAPTTPVVPTEPVTVSAGGGAYPQPAYAATVTPMASRPRTSPAVATEGARLPSNGAAVALPRTMPTSFEERDALLRRMVAARPDRANPFRSPKARVRRARLIMQSLGTTFDRQPNIDLSQYPGNWPELARRDYATAA